MRRLLTPVLASEQLSSTTAFESVSELDLEPLHAMLAALEAECLRVDEAVEVADTLTELAAAAGDGPLSDQTQTVLQVATESLLARVGYSEPALALEKGDLVVYGEHAGLQPKAPPDTRSMGRKILDKVREIWRAIVAAIKRAYQWVVAMFRRFFDIAGMIKAKAESVKKKLEELHRKNATRPFAAFENEHNDTIRKIMTVDGKFTHRPLQDAQLTHRTIALLLERFHSEDLYNGKFFELIKAGKYEEISYDPENEKRTNGLVKKHPGGAGAVFADTWISEPLLGNQWVMQELADKACTGAEAVHWLHHSPQLRSSESESDSETVNPYEQPRPMFNFKLHKSQDQAPVVSLGDALHLVSEAVAVADSVLRFRDVQSKLQKLGDQMERYAEQQLKQDSADDWSAEEPVKMEAVRREFMVMAPRMFAKDPANVVNYALRIARGLSGYCGEIAEIYGQTGKYAKVAA